MSCGILPGESEILLFSSAKLRAASLESCDSGDRGRFPDSPYLMSSIVMAGCGSVEDTRVSSLAFRFNTTGGKGGVGGKGAAGGHARPGGDIWRSRELPTKRWGVCWIGGLFRRRASLSLFLVCCSSRAVSFLSSISTRERLFDCTPFIALPCQDFVSVPIDLLSVWICVVLRSGLELVWEWSCECDRVVGSGFRDWRGRSIPRDLWSSSSQS